MKPTTRMCGATVHTFIKAAAVKQVRREEPHPCYLNEGHDGPHRC
jgi:hypothetical protein